MSPRIAIKTALTLLGLATPSLADSMYSVTDLGKVDPNSNYLNLLNPSDQSAFRSASFDVNAHPAQPGVLHESHQGDIVRTVAAAGDVIVYGGYTTSNNQGVDVGVGSEFLPNVGASFSVITSFYPDPHTAIDASTHQPVQSPGYIGTRSIALPNFNGNISGINDQRNIVGNTNFDNKIPFFIDNLNVRTVPNLGNLGGKNGVASALNNANQVVGWSEVADGTHHAFLYSNGAMQDLNALVPPPGVVLNSAVGIDDAGRVVAFGTDASGVTDEYLLTPGLVSPSPVPEPSTIALAGLVLCGYAVRRLFPRNCISREDLTPGGTPSARGDRSRPVRETRLGSAFPGPHSASPASAG
jgi:probable HAF family extracellular repeat protein